MVTLRENSNHPRPLLNQVGELLVKGESMRHKNRQRLITCLAVLFLFVISFTTVYAADSLLDSGLAEFKAENYEEAIDFFQKARAEQPGLSTPVYYLGLIYKQLGNYKEAVRSFTEAANLAPPISDLYFELADTYYNLGDFTKAKEWIAKAEKANMIPIKAVFLKGLILLKEGDNKAAIEAFTKVRDMDKTLSQAATFQMAIAYSNDKKLTKAREAFKAVLKIDPATDIANYAREYDKVIAANIERHKTWRLTASAAYAYDDNVVLKPSTTIPTLEITGEKDNSLAASARIDYSPLAESEWFLNGQYFVSGNSYFNNKTHNLIVQNIAIMPGYMLKQGAVTMPLSFAYIWLHEKEYMSQASVKPTLNISLIPGHVAQISLGYAYKKMMQDPLSVEEDRDGSLYSASLAYIVPLADNRGVLNMRYEFSRDITKGSNYENTGNKISAGLLLPLKDRLKLILSFEAFQQDYKYNNSAFEVKRKDSIYTGTGMFLWEVYKTLVFNLQYSHTTANSNISVYDYNRNIYTIGLEYGF